MKQNKKLEAEVKQLYNTFWKSMLNVDLKTFTTLVDDDFRMIGTTEPEIFFTKKEVLKFLKDAKEQLAGNIELRNQKIKIESLDQYILITDMSDCYAKIERKWNFYSRCRSSFLLRNTKAGLKFIHQHTSLPDHRTDDGETIALKQVAKENLELRDAVKRRTIELENKNRELEIETSLEKVRSVAMGMKQPDDMLDMCQIICAELQKLGIDEIRNIQTAIIDTEKDTCLNYEYFRLQKKKLVTAVEYKKHKDIHVFVNKMMKDPEGFHTKAFKGAMLKQWIQYQVKDGQFVDPASKKAASLHYYFYSIGPGALGISTYAPLTKEAIILFKRFRNVFQLAYRRFIDIEKATAQAREAQIEAALERVRSRSMAMHDSSEISKVIVSVYSELTKLDARLDRCFFMIVNPQNLGINWWMAGEEGLLDENGFFVQYNEHPSHLMYLDHWKNCSKKWQYIFEGKEKSDWDRFGFEETELVRLPEPVKKFMAEAKKVYLSGSSDEFGCLVTGSFEPLSEEHQDIISRFATVFNQTYTRFNDLKKAEAQTREAKIETALERVRSRTMAMQHSSELSDTARLLFQQIKSLGVPPWSCGFNIWEKGDTVFTSYMGSPDGVILEGLKIPLMEEATFIHFHESRERGDALFIDALEGEALEEHYRYFLSLPEIKKAFEKRAQAGEHRPTFQINHLANFSHGNLMFITYEPCPEAHDIFIRFAKVFEQTYIRFLDLQKAEAQAREAQIEASLERIRSRSMAMHKSEEFPEVIQVVFEQFRQLNFKVDSAQFDVSFRETDDLNLWTAAPGQPYPTKLHIPFIENAVFNSIKKAKEAGLDFVSNQFTVEEKKESFEHFFKHATNVPEERRKFILSSPGFFRSVVLLEKVSLGIQNYSGIPYSDAEHAILKRFAKVFEQTYTRFLDLQKAEAQAREAQINLGVERVRAKALAMHKSEEILGVVITMRKELTDMNIPGVIAATIYLRQENGSVRLWDITTMKEVEEGIHFSMNFDFRMEEAAPDLWIRKIWDAEENYVVVEQDEHDLLRAIEWTRRYNTETAEMTQQFIEANKITHSWHPAVKLSNGKLATDFIQPPSAEVENILSKMGAAFDLAYTRFLDLKKAEAQTLRAEQDLIAIKEAKQKAEDALTELQVTQKQLIQSEKMASLGELTAGIAHEIQNPLNFVNNFSEVSNELIDEMKTEFKKGDIEEGFAIADDIKQNLEKILHHGKRADAIVKGMLQHSSSGSGKKEPMNINALADEYLRLAYHGLRAKDKSFNATMKTDFDESIGNINIIPQDIGRVILNLITNAFYEVDKKKKRVDGDYNPTVSVSTKKENGNVMIQVKDNADGIPQKILDKIFQPFFTTKPTGQGTGLGLSLSYDIVKAHGGELKVETREGEGSMFIITLPITTS